MPTRPGQAGEECFIEDKKGKVKLIKSGTRKKILTTKQLRGQKRGKRIR